MYHAVKICIPLTHPAGEYLLDVGIKATDLLNRVQFLKRQVFTCFGKEEMTANEKGVLDAFSAALPLMNAISPEANRKKAENAEKRGDMESARRWHEKEPVVYSMPTTKKKTLSYNFLDAFLKVTKDPAYTCLPAHVKQNAIKDVCGQWTSFFGLCRAFKEGGIPARPGIPGYIPKGTPSALTFSNTQCSIVQKGPDGKAVTKKNPAVKGAGWYLAFTKDICFPLGKKGPELLGFKEVVCTVQEGRVQVCIVLEKEDTPALPGNGRCAGLDPGVDNLAAIVPNTGDAPVLFDGKWLKSFNRYINKRAAELMAEVAERYGKPASTKQMGHLWQKRADIIRMFYQRVDNLIIKYLKEHDIRTLVAGKNKGWKQEVDMGRENNQKFAMIPHAKILADLKYKCRLAGITYIETEEAYTSAASLFESDDVPGYKPETAGTYRFSGKRVHRGLYRTKGGVLINADVNGGANILRKVFPDAFSGMDMKKLLNPVRIRVQQYVVKKRNVTVTPA